MQVVNVHAVLDRSLAVECSVRHGIYSGLYTTGGQSNRSSQCPLGPNCQCLLIGCKRNRFGGLLSLINWTVTSKRFWLIWASACP